VRACAQIREPRTVRDGARFDHRDIARRASASARWWGGERRRNRESDDGHPPERRRRLPFDDGRSRSLVAVHSGPPRRQFAAGRSDRGGAPAPTQPGDVEISSPRSSVLQELRGRVIPEEEVPSAGVVVRRRGFLARSADGGRRMGSAVHRRRPRRGRERPPRRRRRSGPEVG